MINPKRKYIFSVTIFNYIFLKAFFPDFFFIYTLYKEYSFLYIPSRVLSTYISFCTILNKKALNSCVTLENIP